jgi:predicted RecB family nuclease
MVQIRPDAAFFSPSDLKTRADCAFRFARVVDAKLGKGNVVPEETNAMLRYSGRVGQIHELYLVRLLREQYGVAAGLGERGVYEVAAVDYKNPDRLAAIGAAVDETRAALEAGCDVVFQAALFDGERFGLADFIIREGEAPDGRPLYRVVDGKMASNADNHKEYVWQLATYVEILRHMNIPVMSEARLWLGTLAHSDHDVDLVLDVVREQEDTLRHAVAARRATPDIVAWDDPAYQACGKCASCDEQVTASPDDLLHVYNLGGAARMKYLAAGISSMSDLVSSTGGVPGISVAVADKHRKQAARQIQSAASGTCVFEVVKPEVLRNLPAPSDGDLYFDFETDPNDYVEGSAWLGNAYLFGIYSPLPLDAGDFGFELMSDDTFAYLWADSRAEEEANFDLFMAYVQQRFARYPDMHIFHYNVFEVTTLRRLVKTYGRWGDELELWVEQGLFVNLEPITGNAIVTGLPSLSIKALESIYLPNDKREGVASAGVSVQRYFEYRRALAGTPLPPEEGGTGESASAIKADVLQYNERDCYSTWCLIEWLKGLLSEAHG